jgi:DNA polymerase bacteriophage-type
VDTGAAVYAAHPSTQIMCFAFKVNNGKKRLRTEKDLWSNKLYKHACDPNTLFAAHNSFFEANIWQALMVPLGYPEIPIERWRCTAAKGRAYSLPGKLVDLAAALKFPVQKDMAGNRMMGSLSRPRKPSKDNPDTFFYPDKYPAKFKVLYSYNLDDVEVESYADDWLANLSRVEQEVWFLDQRMNHRGIRLDLPAVHKAARLIKEQKALSLLEFREATNYELNSPQQNAKFKQWLADYGVVVENLQGETIDVLLEDDEETPTLPPNVKSALVASRKLARTSTNKYQAMLDRVSADGRLRDYLMYCGAGRTGRWSGQGVQPQNFLRTPKGWDMDAAIRDLMAYELDMLELIYGNVVDFVAYCVRGMIIASESFELFVSDFSGVESRVMAWLAGQMDLIRLFQDLDAGRSTIDNYCQLASVVFGRPITKAEDAERQLGKMGELALGFGGGIGAFATTAKSNKFNLASLFPLVWPAATEKQKIKAKESYKLYKRRTAKPIGKRAAVASDVIKQIYRKNRKNIVAFWAEMEAAAIACVNGNGPQEIAIGGNPDGRKMVYRMEGSGSQEFLRLRLPSGRELSYHLPRVSHKAMPWGTIKEHLSYVETDSQTKQRKRVGTYGGQLGQHATQATARDLMAYSFLRLEKAGYYPLLSVHDEAISERENGTGDLDEYNTIMKRRPKWARGLPIDVNGWVGQRYKKG